MTIIDKRYTDKNKSVGNRQKFLKRYKSKIKKSVQNIADGKGITDILNDRQVTIDKDEVSEPNYNFDYRTGQRDRVLPGNKDKAVGDKIYQPRNGQGERGYRGEGEDDFTFTLTKEEFIDLYFSEMELPEFIKEGLKGCTKERWKRSGYTKEGIPPRLDLVKTLKQALARRIATNSTRYLDDIDLRYKHFVKQPFPIRQATMILLMDISGSMGEFEKGLAKKFFLLLYLFLNKVYESVEVIFVSHTEEAKEVTEREFFYSQESGGTLVSSGLKLVNEIIDERIDLTTTNVYIAQASDGDNWSGDEQLSLELVNQLLTKVQYFAYIQTESEDRVESKKRWSNRDLMATYEKIEDKKFQLRHVTADHEVYPVLRSLFERK